MLKVIAIVAVVSLLVIGSSDITLLVYSLLKHGKFDFSGTWDAPLVISYPDLSELIIWVDKCHMDMLAMSPIWSDKSDAAMIVEIVKKNPINRIIFGKR